MYCFNSHLELIVYQDVFMSKCFLGHNMYEFIDNYVFRLDTFGYVVLFTTCL